MAGHSIVLLPGYRVLPGADGTPWLAWRGTLGPVYKAVETASGRLCAVTVFHRGLLPDADAGARARGEVERQRGLTHPNFFRPTSLVYAPRGDSFLVADWVGGWPLVDLLRQRRTFAPLDLLIVLRQAATANEYAARNAFPGIETDPEHIFLQISDARSGDGAPPGAPLDRWPGLTLKFNALPIAPPEFSGAGGGGDAGQTVELGRRGPSPVGGSLLGLVCELLGRPARGLRVGPARFSPFPALNEAANAVLHDEAAKPHQGPGGSEAFFTALARALGVDPADVPDAPALPLDSSRKETGRAVIPPPIPRPVPPPGPPTVPPPAPAARPAPEPAPRPRVVGQPPVEFSEAVIQLWRHAATGAADGGCRWIETAHFVIAICQLDFLAQRCPNDPDIAREAAALAQVCGRFGLPPGGLRQAAQRFLGEQPPQPVVGARTRISRSLASKAAFSRAVASVDSAGPPPLVVSSLHLFAAILAQADAPFAAKLCAGRVEPGQLQWELLAAAGALRVAPSDARQTGEKAPVAADAGQPGGGSVLAQFGRDLTALAREGGLRECVGRDEETLRVLRVLGRETKNNPLLVGEAGVGKTALVEGLAWRLAQGRDQGIPIRRIVQLHASSLLAGATMRGQLEARVEALLAELAAAPDTLLFIDEIHQLVGGGDAGGGVLNVAEILKPALSNGALHCVGATTPDEFARYVERDAALARRFVPVRLEEPTPEQARVILEAGYRQRLEARHGVRIEPAALVAAVTLSARYLPDRRLPDKAIDLLDEACVRVTIPSLEPASLVGAPGVVGAEAVAEVLAAWTGLPVAGLGGGERERLRGMAAALQRRVFGQDEACRQVAQAVQRARVGLHAADRPLGVLLFVGPTGAGKTELAKATANFLFGRDSALVRLDMGEYVEKHLVSRLIGAPPGYVGHGEEGQLTGALRRQPFSVVLIDEIEKAHPEVLNLFLQLFDEGRLTDARGRTVRAADALFILTSNLALPARGAVGFGSAPAENDAEPAWRAVLQGTFRPEFVNRLDAIVPFRPLGPERLVEVAQRFLQGVGARLQAQGIILAVSERAVARVARAGEDGLSGVRGVRRAVERQVEGSISERLVAGTLRPGDRLMIDVEGDAFTFVSSAGETIPNPGPSPDP